MCGFAGIVNFSSPQPPAITEQLLRQMGQPVAHRGPDGSGTFISPDGRVGLIHYRLAIVDLPGGGQPMCNEDESVWIVYNGEVYNHAELRAELEAAGHRFKTDHCDTEVIIHGYEQWGQECPKRLRGQFAFAIVDLNRRAVFLARDRLGQKPLYCFRDGGDTFSFGSAVSCFPRGGKLVAGNNPVALSAYLSDGYSIDTVRPADVTAVRPGCSVSFSSRGTVAPSGLASEEPDNRGLTPPANHFRPFGPAQSADDDRWRSPAEAPTQRYWVPGERSFRRSLGEGVAAVRERLIEATEIRLRADVEVGCFLSGGIDSAIIASIVRRELNRPIRTFTVGTPDPAYDEREPARQVAKELGTEHVEFEVQPEHLLDVLDDMIETVAEPFADSSIIPTHWVAKLTRQHVKVALSGDGGDEAFCGYDRYRAVRLAHRLRWTRPIWWLIAPLLRRLGGSGHRDRWTRLARLADGLAKPLAVAYGDWVGLFTRKQVRSLLVSPFDEYGVITAIVAGVFAEEMHRCGDPVESASRTDYQTYLPDDILTKVDRASMRMALEVRSPFLDHKVVELALSLPSKWKLRGRVGKWILRETFKDIVPARVWTQPKRGFALPLDRWFRAESASDPQAGRLLGLLRESVAFLPGEVFNHDYINTLIASHAAGHAEHSQRMWALLWLGRWWNRFAR